jgi:class 3 adenylate cyclase
MTEGRQGSIRYKSLDAPDETRRYPLGGGSLVRIGTHTIGRGVLEPGWRWSTHMAPVMGTASCPVHHLQLLLSGRFAVRMDDGEEVVLGPNDIADIPAGHDAWVVGDEPAILLDIAGNIDAIGVPRGHQRVLTTLLMTDIVDSTRLASQLGDGAWRQRLADHNVAVRVQLARFGGSEVNTTGDGFLAMFASAVSAIRCADAVRRMVRDVGVEIRAGVHTGEVEVMAGDIGGITVHAAARIMSLGGPSEVLVSSTTVDLAEGSGLRFDEAGRHEVKGLTRPVEVYRLAG